MCVKRGYIYISCLVIKELTQSTMEVISKTYLFVYFRLKSTQNQ